MKTAMFRRSLFITARLTTARFITARLTTARFITALLVTILCAPSLLAQAPCDTDYNAFKGPRNFYLNVHNCGTDCAAQELPYLELFREGLTGLRIAPVPRT